MPHLDWIAIAIFCIYALFRLSRVSKTTIQTHSYRIKTGTGDIRTVDNPDEAIKLLDDLQEKIKQGGPSGIRVVTRKIGNGLLAEDKTIETQITNPEEELKIINDVEEKIKNMKKLGPSVNITVQKKVRKVQSMDGKDKV